MEIVKKNLFNIGCGVVALLALIAWFWPVGSMYSSFQDVLKKRVEVDAKIKALKRPHMVPPVDVSTVAQPLTHFPNQATIDAVKGATDALKQNSEQTLKFMVELNQAGHRLLEPGSLPTPLDNNQSFHFRSQYNAVMDPVGKPDPWDRLKPEEGPFNLFDLLNSTKPAVQQDIDDALKKKWESDYLPKVYVVNGQQANLAAVKTDFDRDTANFVADFHMERASRFKMYCDPDTVTRAPRLLPTDTLNAQDIWFGQMTLWIEQDVCQTIHDINKNVELRMGQGIQMSPVKNLVELTINPNMQMYQIGTANPAGGEIDPSAKQPWICPTGRVCNTLYDVVTFKVTVVLDPKHLREFLERLRYLRLLTVTSMAVQDVDWKSAADLGYIYGPARCVRVSMDCEELFMRDWTVRQLVPDQNHPAPMPVDVQKLLGITPQPPAAPPAPNRVAMQ